MTFFHIGAEALRPLQADIDRMEAELAYASRRLEQMEANRIPDDTMRRPIEPIPQARQTIDITVTIQIEKAPE